MTYTEQLEHDMLKLREQLQETVNWLTVEFIPEFSSDINEKPVQNLIQEINYSIDTTNRHAIANQTSLFEEEKPSISEIHVEQSIICLSKRLRSNADCIRSITQESLLLNLRACGMITNELIIDLSTKRISRNEGANKNTEPRKE